MSVMRLYQQNRVFSLSTLKNGTGGGAPALDEDAQFPTANAKFRSRNRFWRSSSAPTNPVDLDYDLITTNTNIDAVGLGNIRSYRGTAGIVSLEVFYGTGSVYPPTWVQALAPQTIATTDNDLMFDISPPNFRFIRFRIGNAGQFSCKPWAVVSTDVVALQEGFDLREAVGRIRAAEAKTLLGAVVFTDLGVGKAQRILEWKFADTATTVQKAAALAAQNGRERPAPMFRDIYGRHQQVTVLEPTARWRRSGVLISTRVEMDYALVQQP
jgi:hypothetical protein